MGSISFFKGMKISEFMNSMFENFTFTEWEMMFKNGKFYYTNLFKVMNVLHFLQKPEDKGKKIISVKKRRSSSKSSGKKTKRNKSEKKGICMLS